MCLSLFRAWNSSGTMHSCYVFTRQKLAVFWTPGLEEYVVFSSCCNLLQCDVYSHNWRSAFRENLLPLTATLRMQAAGSFGISETSCGIRRFCASGTTWSPLKGAHNPDHNLHFYDFWNFKFRNSLYSRHITFRADRQHVRSANRLHQVSI